ncbi:MAG: hypothetical protein WC862_05205 [Patescibacteria group bacterium]
MPTDKTLSRAYEMAKTAMDTRQGQLGTKGPGKKRGGRIEDRMLESQIQFEELKRELLDWAKTRVVEAEPKTIDDVQRLCAEIDKKLIEIKTRFIQIYKKNPQKINPKQEWNAFLRSLNRIRTDAKIEILRRFKKAEGAPIETPASTLEESEEYAQMEIARLSEEVEIALDMADGFEQETAALRTSIAALREEILRLKTKTETEETIPDEKKQKTQGDLTEFLTERRNALLDIEKQIDKQIDRLESAYAHLLTWLPDAQTRAEVEINEQKKIFEAQSRLGFKQATGEYQAVQKEQTNLRAQIKMAEEKLKTLDETIEIFRERKRGITKHLEALNLIGSDLDTNLPVLDDSILDTGSILLISDKRNEEKSEQETDRQKEDGTDTEEDTIRVGDLPFTVEFTTHGESEILNIESKLAEFIGIPTSDLKKQFPFEPKDDYQEKLYEHLIADLSTDALIERTKLAIAILGAMRDGDKFKARTGTTVNIKIRSKAVGLAKNLAEASLMASGVYAKLELLAQLRPGLQLIKKLSIGNRWGRANRLTPIGEIASMVWTKDLIDEGKITKKQLIALHASGR